MPVHRIVVAVLVASLCTVTAVAGDPLVGRTQAEAERARQLEAQFDSHLDPGNLRTWMERMAARPHPVGSEWSRANAEFMRDLFRSWGLEAELATYEVLFPTPKVRRLELVSPSRFRAGLEEPALDEDRTSGQKDEQLPTYNAYSVDGDVSGELVYVNYGRPDDYEELDRRGIDVAGKIVIARYGGAWRGIKPKVAAERGAVGCIIFTDPRDDGYFQNATYPEGGMRPNSGVQRGSVADMPLFPGDPLTPGVGATPEAERLPIAEAPTLTKIPVLPISADDALPLLSAMEGPVAPEGWRGALPITYRLGPGEARVELELEFDWGMETAYDVIAKLPGAVYPDEWVLRGNHHDAWVNGATDPVSGMVAVLEEARAISELVKTGWRPKRTIVWAGWDAEEPGLLGSVEWAEHHAAELREKAVAYINSDSNSRGFFYSGGSHGLERLVNQASREVKDPVTGHSAWERGRAWLALFGEERESAAALAGQDLPMPALGSGSDFTPFLQHLTIASLHIGFGGEGQYGQYHSIYDSIDHFQRFMDPEYDYGIALAKVAGRITLRLADAEVLPFEFGGLAGAVRAYTDEVVALADAMRVKTERTNRAIEQGFQRALAHPDEPFVEPSPEPPVPHLNFAPLRNGAAALERAAAGYSEALAAYVAAGEPLPAERAEAVNRALIRTERALGREAGLPDRPWYRHFLYAPGFYTGYGVKTLPGVREGIEARKWDQVEPQVEVLAEVLAALVTEIDRATASLSGTP